MDPLQLLKLCKQNCTQKELPLFQDDYSSYHAKTKGNTPLKQFSSLTENEQNNFYKFVFYDNRLNEIANQELQYLLFCYLIESGSNKTKSLIQEALDMQPQQQLTCRNIQALQQGQNDKNLIEKVKKMPKQFKAFAKSQLQNLEDSFSSDTTCEDEECLAKRLEYDEKVLKVQNLLKKQGYNIETDGFYTSQTENAVREYQKKNNLFEDGVISQELINKIEGKAQKQQGEKSNQVGGIDLKTKLNEVCSIRGIKFNNKNQLKFLLDKKQKLEFSGTEPDDLALCLKVYCDQSIKNKTISFSLDPWEDKKPDGEFQRKVLYPDILENKKILSGSKFSELMFECDYLLKQMSLGLLPDCKTPFPYPQELVKLGLKPLSKIIEENNINQDNSKQNWSRLWLVCKKVEGIVDKNNKGVFLSNDVKIEVDARQMEQDSQGRLIDKVVQDKNDPCYMFAKKFSELYPVICKHYPCFERLKKLYRASALARWIVTNGIQIDMKKINQVIEKQFSSVKMYTDKVNSIRQSQEIQIGIVEKKLPVDVKVVAERSLKQSGQEVNEKNLKLAVEYLIKQNNGSSEFFDIQKAKKVQTKFVLGGVDMNCQISPINQNSQTPQSNKSSQSVKGSSDITFTKIQNQSNTKPGTSQKTNEIKSSTNSKPIQQTIKEKVKAEEKKVDDTKNDDYESDFYSTASTSVTSLDDELIQQQVKEEDFFFSLQANCQKCQKVLTQKEQMFPVEQKYYCQVHHPHSCFYCGKLIKEQAATVNGRAELYDSDSFKNKQVYMHLECNLIFQNKCVDRLNIDKQNEEIQRVNKNVLEQIQKNLPKIKSLNEVTLKKGSNFSCIMCKKNNNNSTQIICSLCGLISQAQANNYLKEAFQTK
ncbi:peptidoglycan-binding domain protein (macronuclear) [Tetrahymena thermophila SB210]|uniref:Peptidoglycan-binding domain protein n=1 Tax=Tetrahymena thermophila (strain SB210) TaxID=312017 RepID=I7LVZ6_TETTS|nr:peptidoglycan-binding domain protein [Tetrahymena thermophila SB210]EAS00403.1 peptidoglycan-binding domain protein [Tetrahymena thermophila SB210]|eukprot:XP_001020648.1 peptidoglycan-binding domain protein [Tetrahymena thermophila SB210]